MTIDTVTLTMAVTLVAVTTTVIFISETLLRRDTGAGRVWALAFLAVLLATCCYFIGMLFPDMWWAVACGVGAHVAGIGLMWLGCRRFNRATLRAPSVILALVAGAVLVAALLVGPSRANGYVSVATSAVLAGLAGAGMFESLRGEMRRHRNAVGLAIALGAICLYNIARVIAVVVDGADGEIVTEWLGPRTTGILSIVLMIVAVVTVSVLRAGRARMPGVPVTSILAVDEDGVLVADAFVRGMGRRMERAKLTGSLMGVISTRVADMPRITSAFGASDAAEILRTWRAAVHRHAPMSAILGDEGAEGMLIAIHPQSVVDARRSLSQLRRGITDAFIEAELGLVPVAETGMALTDASGYDIRALIDDARADARRAARALRGDGDADQG